MKLKNLETWFLSQDIKDIHTKLVIYELLKLKQLPEEKEDQLQLQCEATIKNKERIEKEDPDAFKNYEKNNILLVENRLNEYQKIYNDVIQHNMDTINQYAVIIEEKIIQQMNKKQTQVEKLNFLFDFVTHYVIFSQNYFDFCQSGISSGKYTFDFEEGIPVEHSLNGTLVLRQGTATEITNLIAYLGKMAGLKIETSACKLNGYEYSINYVISEDNKVSFIDATSVIKKELSKDEAFLVSSDLLLRKNQTYTLPECDSVTYNCNIDTTEEIYLLTNELEQILPTIENLYEQMKLQHK